MDSTERVEIARKMVEAFARRDIEAVLPHMTEDVVVHSTPYVTGRGEYRGREAVRAGIESMATDLAGVGKRLRIVDLAYYVDGGDENRVLNLAQITIQRASGEEFGTDIAYLSTFAGDLICEVEAWLDHSEGLAHLESPVRIA